MKPEYQFKVEGLVNKEQVMTGLLASGYILSCEKKFGDIYEISVYGKQRVDGTGGKQTDWFEKMDKQAEPKIGGKGIIDCPKVTSTTTKIPDTWIGSGNIYTSSISCDPKFLIDANSLSNSPDWLNANRSPSSSELTQAEMEAWEDHLNKARESK
jgi:hypothetical protein